MADSADDLKKLVEDGDRALIELYATMERDEVMSYLLRLKADPLYQAIERMHKNSYHLWCVLHELYLSPYSDSSLLEEWRRAPEGSQEWRKARRHDEAVEILMVAARGR